jgi:putative molybdopterin biosynthesis protein
LTGDADCCIAPEAVARALGLDFVPLASERYDLVIPQRFLEMPAIASLLDVLQTAAFRRSLSGLGGYDVSVTGQRIHPVASALSSDSRNRGHPRQPPWSV